MIKGGRGENTQKFSKAKGRGEWCIYHSWDNKVCAFSQGSRHIVCIIQSTHRTVHNSMFLHISERKKEPNFSCSTTAVSQNHVAISTLWRHLICLRCSWLICPDCSKTLHPSVPRKKDTHAEMDHKHLVLLSIIQLMKINVLKVKA